MANTTNIRAVKEAMRQPSKGAAETPSGDREYPHRYTSALADAIELKWQGLWESEETFAAINPSEKGFDAARPKYFVLDMFPYPSGAGLHVGHPEGYTATDIVSRYKRHRGFNVLHPMGWDAFGLPAEQYAIATGVHPAITTRQAIDTFRRQLKRFGFSYDWGREFATIDPEYYRWTQWIFLRIYDSWYDATSNKARSIGDLIGELESGKREVRINPDAAEFSPAEKSRRFANWKSLGKAERRLIIDSYRLAYIAEQTVNWCPKLGTALANEEVIDGKSERGGFPVFRKPLRQWMFRITAYAERLLNDLELVKWPESTRVQQSEWIGKSEGAEVDFEIPDLKSQIPDLKSIRVFTTRPDTIFGATFMVVAPEHPLVGEILKNPPPETDVKKLRAYVEAARNRSDVDRMAETKEKTGIFTGVYAINPAIDAENPLWTNQHRIPIWVADYVLMSYGHGAIMAVPSHDQRDLEFSRRFDITTQNVVMPPDNWLREHIGEALGKKSVEEIRDIYRHTNAYFDEVAFEGEGVAINSENSEVSLNGLPTPQAKDRIIEWLEKSGRGVRKVNYKLRDWLFSRQRYWGEPFPIVFDEAGNHWPVDESHLPVVLPQMKDYQPVESDEPRPLLAKAKEWVNTTAGKAGVSAKVLAANTPVKRETNTMPNWAGSCWYYLRFTDPRNHKRFVAREGEKYWMVSTRTRRAGPSSAPSSAGDGSNHAGGVDLYIGGAEQAVLHLLYARFWHKVLFDLGEVSTPEPFGQLFHQGLITSFAYKDSNGRTVPVDEVEERDGRFVLKQGGAQVDQIVAKMSKTLKNVVNPDDVIGQYGADTFRLYEMYMGPLEASKPWNPRDIEGPFRFLQRAWRLVVDEQSGELRVSASRDEAIEKQLHRTIAKVSDDIERLSFNTAIAAMIEFVNAATKVGGLTRDQLARFAVVLSPFAPHMAEELWSKLGHRESIAYEPWPAVDEGMLRDDQIEMPVQIMGKVRGKITVAADADEATVRE
ncbi:MAG: leucine--tRNA ligase, partial [Phycisphaerales bacterium]|nr:leucine--tRNA ligase [Phycisphaerales bacterium]